jgi:two-component system sensor histidine kinase EvgS
VLTKFLELEGFTPAVASNGYDALKYLRAGGEAKVIVLDLRMPVMDGWACLKAQRADPDLALIPVVVLSGAETERLPEAEAAVSFRKPVSFPDVIDAVRRLCQDRSAP